MLTIIRGWYISGTPWLEESTDRSDDFMTWTSSMRAMLRWAGFPGSFGGSSQKVAIAADPDTDDWAEFLAAIHDHYGEREWTVKDLVQELENYRDGEKGVDPVHLPGDLADKWSRAGYGKRAGFSKSLGRWLSFRAGRYADGWKAEKIETTGHHAQMWRVIEP